MMFFYVPFYYTVVSRLHSFSKSFSWVIIYLIPQFIFYFYFLDVVDYRQAFLYIALGVILIYTLYEIGYIYNDTETIKNEVQPTLRLDNFQLSYYHEHKVLIYSIRALLAFIISLIFIHLEQYYFVLFVWCIIPIYAVYNSIRNRWNLPLHFCLVVIRYCSVTLLLGGGMVFFYCVLLFPVINLLERCSEKRFQLPFFQKNVFSNKVDGRYKYYCILIIIAGLLLFNEMNWANLVFLFLSLYYFVYRWLIVKFKMV